MEAGIWLYVSMLLLFVYPHELHESRHLVACCTCYCCGCLCTRTNSVKADMWLYVSLLLLCVYQQELHESRHNMAVCVIVVAVCTSRNYMTADTSRAVRVTVAAVCCCTSRNPMMKADIWLYVSLL